MKKLLLSAATVLMSVSGSLNAQELPQMSPSATVEQRIGLTDLEVVYSRPAARGREIFGDLVPYDQVWRTGANSCTKFTTSSQIEFGGKKLKPGTYALFTIPGQESWMIIVSNQTDLWGNTGYTSESDVLRVKAPALKSDFDENFTISFKNVGKEKGQLSLEWGEVEVQVNIDVDTDSQSAKNVAQALAQANTSYRNAADYYSGKGEHEKALETIDLALKLDPNNWYTNWVKAEILHNAGKNKDAVKQGQKALNMGQEFYDSRGMKFDYRAGLEKEMENW